MSSTLMTMKGAQRMTRAQLVKIPAPPALGRVHKPIPHSELVETLTKVVGEKELEIVSEQFAVQDGSKNGVAVPSALIFGVLDLKPHAKSFKGYQREGMSFALGFRSGNNKKMPLELAAGAHVFVCDNLAFSAEMIALKKKHTSGLDLTFELGGGVDRYLVKQVQAVERIDRAAHTKLSDETAKALMFDTFQGGYIPTRFLTEVASNYFEPDPKWTDCQGRHLWALHNAFTRVLAPHNEEQEDGTIARVERFAPRSKFEATANLGKLLELKLN